MTPAERLQMIAPTEEAQRAFKYKLVRGRYEHPITQAKLGKELYEQLFPASVMTKPRSPDFYVEVFRRMAGLNPEFADQAFIDDTFVDENLDAVVGLALYGKESPDVGDVAKRMYDQNLAPVVGPVVGFATGGPVGAVLGTMHTADTALQDFMGWGTLGLANKVGPVAKFLSSGSWPARIGKEAVYSAGEGIAQRVAGGDSLSEAVTDVGGLGMDALFGAAGGTAQGSIENLTSRKLFKGTPAPASLMHQDVNVPVPLSEGKIGTKTIEGEKLLNIFKNPERIEAFQKASGMAVDPRTVTEGAVPLYSPKQRAMLESYLEAATQSATMPPVSAVTPRPRQPLRQRLPGAQAPVTPIIVTPKTTTTRIEGGSIEYPELPESDIAGVRAKLGTGAETSYQRLRELTRDVRTDELAEVAPVQLSLLGDIRDISLSGKNNILLEVIQNNKLGGSQNNFKQRQAPRIPVAARELASRIPGLPEDRAAMIITTALKYASPGQSFDPKALKRLVAQVDEETDDLMKTLIGPYQPVTIEGIEITETIPGRVDFDLETSRNRETAAAERLAQQVPKVEEANAQKMRAYEDKVTSWEARETARQQRLANFKEKQRIQKEVETAKKVLRDVFGETKIPTAQDISKAAITNPEQAIKHAQTLSSVIAKTPEQELDFRTNLLIDFLRELQDPGTVKSILPEGRPGTTRLREGAITAINRAGTATQGTHATKAKSYLDYLTGSEEATKALVETLNTEGLMNMVASQADPQDLRAYVKGMLVNLGARLHYSRGLKNFAADFQRPTIQDSEKMKKLRDVALKTDMFVRPIKTENVKEHNREEPTTWEKLTNFFSGKK